MVTAAMILKDAYSLEEKFLYCEGHSERFTALHGEEKREEGVRGDPNEITRGFHTQLDEGPETP